MVSTIIYRYRDIGCNLGPTILYLDNDSLIQLSVDYSGNHKKSKHYLMRINFLIELA